MWLMFGLGFIGGIGTSIFVAAVLFRNLVDDGDYE